MKMLILLIVVFSLFASCAVEKEEVKVNWGKIILFALFYIVMIGVVKALLEKFFLLGEDAIMIYSIVWPLSIPVGIISGIVYLSYWGTKKVFKTDRDFNKSRNGEKKKN